MHTGEQFYKLASLQMVLYAGTALLLGLLEKSLGFSWFLGASVAILPQYVFTRLVFRRQGKGTLFDMVADLYQAELIKFIVTALLFVLVLTLVSNLNPWAFFSAFLMAIVSHLGLALRSGK